MSTDSQPIYSPLDRSCFKKDTLDRIRIKNLKRAFKSTPESKDKPVTLYKITN